MAIIKCPECGADISDAATTCPHCGAPLKQNTINNDPPSDKDVPEFGWQILSFLIPIIGLILYLVETPKKSKSYGKCALAGLITDIVLVSFIAIWPYIIVSSLL